MKIELTKKESHYMSIVSDIVNRNRNYCSKDYGDREHIVDCTNININHVKVDGDALYCVGNVIKSGFKKVTVVKDGVTGEECGTRTELEDITSELWNSENLHYLKFSTNIMDYEFIFNK